LADIFMLVLLTGKERTRADFDKLLTAAGFRSFRVIDIGVRTFLLEAAAV
jgi:hypothetical protein